MPDGSRAGVRLNLGSGIYVIDGFVNLDKETGWLFEDGLPYPDSSVEGITVAHALMYVELHDWPAVFAEFARVLEPGGVVRISEDNTTDPASERYGGFEGAVTLTDAKLVMNYLTLAGLETHQLGADETLFSDRSLIQKLHGAEPKVFFVEGVKS